MSIILKNRSEVVEQLTEILMEFAKDCKLHLTYVYLYYDKKTQTAKVVTRDGYGCYLPDDKNDCNVFYIYSVDENYQNWTDYYCGENDFAWGLDMPNDEFDKEVVDFLELDEDDKEDYKVEYIDKYNYVISREDYMDKLIEVYYEAIDDMRDGYAEYAEEIIKKWEEEDKRREEKRMWEEEMYSF